VRQVRRPDCHPGGSHALSLVHDGEALDGGRGGLLRLDAPIRRVASACVPLPIAANLEQAVVPTATKVTAVAHEVLDHA
jgi:hypothetical protein